MADQVADDATRAKATATLVYFAQVITPAYAATQSMTPAARQSFATTTPILAADPASVPTPDNSPSNLTIGDALEARDTLVKALTDGSDQAWNDAKADFDDLTANDQGIAGASPPATLSLLQSFAASGAGLAVIQAGAATAGAAASLPIVGALGAAVTNKAAIDAQIAAGKGDKLSQQAGAAEAAGAFFGKYILWIAGGVAAVAATAFYLVYGPKR